jgi:hypothetical protein
MIARYGFQARYGLAAGSNPAGPANLRLQRKLRHRRPGRGLVGSAYCFPAVLKRERSQLGSAYCVRRSPSRSSMTFGRQRACQAERASASAFCSSGVCGGAARMTPEPLMLKPVDWLGVGGIPAAMAAALAAAAAAAAFAAFAASAARPWSIDHVSCGADAVDETCGADAVAESCCADAVEFQAATMNKAPRTVRILKSLKEMEWSINQRLRTE